MGKRAGKTHKAAIAKTTKRKALEAEASLLVPEKSIEQNDHGTMEVTIGNREEVLNALVNAGVERGELLSYQEGKSVKVFDPKGEGLRPGWVRFIDEYFKCEFNGTEAYMQAYPHCKNRKTAGVEACRLLKVPSIVEEIRYRLDSSRCTDDYVVSRLMHQSQFVDSFRINAAVAATATLAKVRGLLVDTKKPSFSNENPAVFAAPFTKEEMEEMQTRRAKMGRIVE